VGSRRNVGSGVMMLPVLECARLDTLPSFILRGKSKETGIWNRRPSFPLEPVSLVEVEKAAKCFSFH
jgi:hypothetical protein